MPAEDDRCQGVYLIPAVIDVCPVSKNDHLIGTSPQLPSSFASCYD